MLFRHLNTDMHRRCNDASVDTEEYGCSIVCTLAHLSLGWAGGPLNSSWVGGWELEFLIDWDEYLVGIV